MTEAEVLVKKFNAETKRVIYTTQEAWDEGVSCVELLSGKEDVSLCEFTQ